MKITEVTAENFEQEVLQAEQTVLVDFWAAWCNPCKMLSPIVDQVAEEHPEIKVCKVNIDNETQLALRHKVMSIPTLMVFKNGEVTNQSVGLQDKTSIEAML